MMFTNKLQNTFVLLFILPSFLFSQVSPDVSLWKNEIFHSYDPNNEIIALRSENSKHFINPSTGEVEAIISNGFLNYFENNEWKTIFNTIELNSTGKHEAYKYTNAYNSYKTYYSSQSDQLGILTSFSSGEMIEFINPSYFFANEWGEQLSIPTKHTIVDAVINKNELKYTSIFPNIDAIFTQHSKQRKLDYIIQNNAIISQAPLETKYLVFEEEIMLPPNWTAKISANKEVVFLLNEKNELVCKANQPRFYEEFVNQERIPFPLTKNSAPICTGTYKISQIDNQLTLSLLVPFDWLSFPHRKFPLKIDPTWDYIPNNAAYWSGAIRTSNFVYNLNTIPTLTNIYQVFNDFISLGSYAIYYDPYWGDYEAYWDHGYCMFNTSSIPSSATVSAASFTVNPYIASYPGDGASFGLYIRDFTSNSLTDPFATMLSDIRSGNIYHTTNLYNIWNGGNYSTITLPSTSVSEIQSRLTSGRYGLGLHAYSGGAYWDTYIELYGRSSIYAPFITVTYTNPLPVKLTQFSGNCINHQIKLQWETASEKNNAYFVVEKSYDATHWTYVNRISGQGNSNTTQNYSIIDTDASNTMIYYRLTQVDFDGKEEVFSPIQVHNCNGIQLPNLTVFPNPVENSAQIEVTSPIDVSNAQLTILDMNGKVIQSSLVTLSAGTQQLPLSTENWSSGVYQIHITSNEVAFKAIKFIKR